MQSPKLLLLALCAATAFAQAPFEHWPGATYDPAVPSMRKCSATTPATASARTPT